jgi:Spx/MgsR family transcriptional regulator
VDEIVLYGLPNCGSCDKAQAWLRKHQVGFRFVDYRTERIAPELLRSWATALGWSQLINRAGTTWKMLPPSRKHPQSDPEWTLLIKEYPTLVKRPALTIGAGAPTLGFSDSLYKRVFARD